MDEKEVTADSEKLRLIVGKRIEEGLILLLVFLGIIKFFGFLPGDIDFVSNLVSWITLGYLLYETSFTKIFYGTREILFDLILILSIFLLQVKDFLAYFSIEKDLLSIKSASIFHDFFIYSIQNQDQIMYVTFSIGTAIIIALSIYFGLNMKSSQGSLMNILIGTSKENPSMIDKIKNAIINYFVFMSVYLFIINPLLEWIAISLDAPLVIIAIVFYITQAKRFGPETFLFKLGDFGENIFTSFINLFKTKSTLFLGVFSIFGVKLIVDMISYIFPLVTGYEHSYYLIFDSLHQPLLKLFLLETNKTTIINSISLFFIYFFNILAIFLIALVPVFIWYSLYKKQKYSIPNILIGLFFFSTLVLVFFPIFNFTSIDGDKMIGVDISTSPIASSTGIIHLPLYFVYIFFGLSIILYMLLRSGQLKRSSLIMSGMASMFFLTIYFVYFFISTHNYYISLLTFFFSSSQLYMFTIFLTFFLTNIIFYIVGYISFIIEYSKEFRNIY